MQDKEGDDEVLSSLLHGQANRMSLSAREEPRFEGEGEDVEGEDERNKELEDTAEKMNVARISFFCGDHIEKNLLRKCKEDFETIVDAWKIKNYLESLDPWILLNNERIRRNEELFSLKTLDCVSRFANKYGRNMLSFIARIEKRKSKKKFEKLMNMFARWERARIPANTMVTNKTLNYNQPINVRREVTTHYGKKCVIKSHIPHYFPGFHPVRSGFSFGY